MWESHAILTNILRPAGIGRGASSTSLRAEDLTQKPGVGARVTGVGAAAMGGMGLESGLRGAGSAGWPLAGDDAERVAVLLLRKRK